jgi:hypothetical protein
MFCEKKIFFVKIYTLFRDIKNRPFFSNDYFKGLCQQYEFLKNLLPNEPKRLFSKVATLREFIKCANMLVSLFANCSIPSLNAMRFHQNYTQCDLNRHLWYYKLAALLREISGNFLQIKSVMFLARAQVQRSLFFSAFWIKYGLFLVGFATLFSTFSLQ